MKLAHLDTERLAALLAGDKDVVVLQPVGSVEPHGPHLPLNTDTAISEAVAARAVSELSELVALVAPSVPYGVTDYAEGFAGAISVPAAVLTPLLRAIVSAYLAQGFAHVCLINNHLEPEHDAAVRAAIEGMPPQQATVACPLTRRWARTLSDEFKSGACHAGRYETSLVLAAAPETVDTERADQLPSSDISLSSGIRDGLTNFKAMGIDRAYTGAPSEASRLEGDELLTKLATMVVTEIREARGN